MFNEPIMIGNSIKIKYSAAPRSGTHFFEAIMRSIQNNSADYDFSGLALSHDFDILGKTWNLVTSIRDPKECVLSHAAMIAHNVGSDISEHRQDLIIKKAIDDNLNWYRQAILRLDRFNYIFSFDDFIQYPQKNMNSLFSLFKIHDILDSINFNGVYDSIDNSEKDGFLKTSKTLDYYDNMASVINIYDISESYELFNIINNFRIDNV